VKRVVNARSTSLAFGIAFLIGGIGFTQCRVDTTIDDRAWPCTRAAECGTKDGEPMACWRNYCMPTCTPVPDPDRRDFVCLEAGARGELQGVRLEKCVPYSDGSAVPVVDEGGCGPGFQCYRTDLILNEGVCVPFNVCTKDSECPGEARTYCASVILEERLADAIARRPGVFTDHLLCVDTACRQDDEGGVENPGLQCPEGEECLGEAYSLEGNDLPDICVPHCDANRRCLPNFACATSAFAKGTNTICVPGFPGVRCERDIDCIVAKCEETGVEFAMCTIPCDSDEECALALNSGPTIYRCAGSREDGQKVCINTSAFHGVQCKRDADCDPATPKCFAFSPFGDEDAKPECRMECDAGECPRRGGLGHVCLKDGEGGCYPGEFALPCNADSECLTPFECLAAAPTGREVLPGPNICSVRCGDDADCEAVAILQGSTYCEEGVCRTAALPGKPCVKPAHCISNECNAGVCGNFAP
jgi:hypothetical protein